MQLLLTLVWHFQSLRGLLPGGSGSHPPGRPPLSDRDEPHSSPYDEGSPVSCKGGGVSQKLLRGREFLDTIMWSNKWEINI